MDIYCILTHPIFKSAINEEEFNSIKSSFLYQIDLQMDATVQQRVEIIGGTNYFDELEGSSGALSHI